MTSHLPKLLATIEQRGVFLSTSATPTGANTAPDWIQRASLVGVLLLTFVGCAVPERESSVAAPEDQVVEPLQPPSLAPRIFGGQRDDDPRANPGVVALKIPSGLSHDLCSGALIAPNVVLTARHCVIESVTTRVACDESGNSKNGKHVQFNKPASDIEIFTGASVNRSKTPAAIGRELVTPTSDYLCNSDIAMVVLDRDIADVEPMAIRLGASVQPGEKIRSVGYGSNDAKLPLGTRLRKDGVEVLAIGSTVSKSKTALGPHEFEVGRSICEGDSGGPAISEDTGAVVGVVSRGGRCELDYGNVYIATAGWEKLFEQAFAIAGGAPIVEWVEPKPDSAPTPAPPPPPATEGSSCSMTAARSQPRLGPIIALLASLGMLAARSRHRRTRTQ